MAHTPYSLPIAEVRICLLDGWIGMNKANSM